MLSSPLIFFFALHVFLILRLTPLTRASPHATVAPDNLRPTAHPNNSWDAPEMKNQREGGGKNTSDEALMDHALALSRNVFEAQVSEQPKVLSWATPTRWHAVHFPKEERAPVCFISARQYVELSAYVY